MNKVFKKKKNVAEPHCPDAPALAPPTALWLYDFIKNSGKFGPFCKKK
jgi:hypothetical protein